MAYSYKHLLTPRNSTVGIGDEILWAPIEAFAVGGISMPTPGATPAPGDEVIVTADHSFLTGEGFIRLLCAPFKNKLSAEGIGDTGSQKFDFKQEFNLPGSYKELHEFVKNAINRPGIALIRDNSMAEKIYYQIGTDFIYAWLSGGFSSGEDARSGSKGYKLTLACPMEYPILYEGAVTVKPAPAP